MSAHIEVAERELDGPHGSLRVRTYAPSAATGPGLVWVHGGGFAGGELDMPEGDWVSRSFAERGIAVVSVDYHLAPTSAVRNDLLGLPGRGGVHYPVAHDEIVFAFRWALGSGLADGAWALGGASAGGNLAAGAALRLTHAGGPAPALAVLAYPTLHAVQDAPDAVMRALLDADPESDRFGPDAVLGMYENYLGGPAQGADVYAIPGTASTSELTGFPATIMINDETDELRVSGEAFARALDAAGVEVDVSTEPGTTHGHLNRPELASATASIDRFADRIRRLPHSPVTAPADDETLAH
ncbi:alpha/beta hydrolase [Microbacterium murale]|uniref:Acetyl esterase n=1 Tax=Microbacterium murale TaxID=1081040 RepID=A0ABU0PA17_9MICO|nr:alpha/beta hydrolase [Microbacterium murale]MDQ0644175.1 acetyl esterase [Microbacterium murale]